MDRHAIAALCLLCLTTFPALSYATVIVPDASGNGLDATFQGTPDFVCGCVDRALEVDGALNYGVVSPTASQLLQALTVEGYFLWDGNTDGLSPDRYIINKVTQHTDAGRSWSLVIQKNTRKLRATVFYNSQNGHVAVEDPNPLPDPMTECVQVAFTVSAGGQLNLYRDGELVAAEQFPHSINYSTNTAIYFANSQNWSAPMDGLLDMFRISDIVRTEFPTTPQNLSGDEHTIGLWRFGGSDGVWSVPSEVGTIQAAIDSACPGDTVLVAAGTYNEHDIELTNGVVLLGSGAETTIIDAQGLGRVIECTDVGSSTVIRGFTLRNGIAPDNGHGEHWGGGILCGTVISPGAIPLVADCVIESCYAQTGGGGLYSSGDGGRVEDCIFRDNVAGVGGGIILSDAGAFTIEGCTFERDSCFQPQFRGGGAIALYSSSAEITDCDFSDNRAEEFGAGVFGIHSGAEIAGCVFTGNHSGSHGGAAFSDTGAVFEFSSCTFYGNSAGTGQGSGLFVDRDGAAFLSTSIVAFGTGSGIACQGWQDTIDVACCDVYGNSGGDWVDCIAPFAGVAGNIGADPMFHDAENGDLGLRHCSPCAPENSGGCGLIGAFASESYTTTIHVPGDFESIQEAIDHACPGDTVLVAAGTYNEHDIVLMDGVKLLSESGAEATTIDAQGLGRVILASGVGPATEVIGFTIKGGNAEHGGGIRCVSASPLIEQNVIVDNYGSGNYGGGGVFCTGGSDPIIRRNVIARNASQWGSGGIYVYDTNDNPTIEWNTIVYNTTSASEPHGGGIYLRNGADATIENNIVCFNDSRGLCGNDAGCTVRWNNVFGNVLANYCGSADMTGIDGNISVDPRFAFACPGFAGSTIEDSLHLCFDSPCIDAADPSATDPDGSRSDMGAYPFEGTPALPRIVSVEDVANDQGRRARIEWTRSRFDGSGESLDSAITVTSYALYRRIDDLPNEGWPSKVAWPSGDWDYIMDVPAMGESLYHAAVPTLIDSVPGQDSVSSWSWFFVAARTPDPLVSFYSHPGSGYSIDNLPPNVPGGFTASPGHQAIELFWKRNWEPDFKHYAIYRGTEPGFDPLAATPIAILVGVLDTAYTDTDLDPEVCEYYYRLAAFDQNANRSEFSAEVHSSYTAIPGAGVPSRYALYANVPNPFNPLTKIVFSIPEPAQVNLTVHDVSGRAIATLAEGRFPAGEFTRTWDGRDTNGRDVPSGVYLARITAGSFTATQKMTLLR
jgi:hypothetical protein